jgi:hypothetical protein
MCACHHLQIPLDCNMSSHGRLGIRNLNKEQQCSDTALTSSLAFAGSADATSANCNAENLIIEVMLMALGYSGGVSRCH